MFAGILDGKQTVQLWAAVLATIAALYRHPVAAPQRHSDRPPPLPKPGDKLWPLAVFGSPELVDLVGKVWS